MIDAANLDRIERRIARLVDEGKIKRGRGTMWSDPIDNAFGILQSLLDQTRAPTADQIERTKRVVEHARKVRAFEQQENRLVTPEDML